MKRKYVLLTMGMVLSIVMSGGCSGKGADENAGASSGLQQETAGTDNAQKEMKENALYGEVSEIGSSSLIIQTGTLKEMGQKPDMDSVSKEGESAGEKESDRPSMLDLTGEEREIAVTEDTIIKRRSGGGSPGEGGGRAEPPQGDGEAPEKPKESNEEPERPEGNGEASEKNGDNGGTMNAPKGKERPQAEEEEITLTDISEGDIVEITLNDDGSAAEIVVMTMGAGMGDMGNPAQASVPDSYEAATV